MTKILIEAGVLFAMARYSSKYGARGDIKQLNGVHIKISGGTGYAVATDGNMMIVHKFTTAADDCEFTIPSKHLIKLDPCPRAAIVTIDFDSIDFVITTSTDSISGTAILAPYPDWREVVPKEVTFKNEFVGFSPNLSYALLRAARDMNTKVFVIPNGDGPALVQFERSDLTGALAPYRDSGRLTEGAVFKPPFA